MQQFKIVHPKIVQKIHRKRSYPIRYKTLGVGKPGLRNFVYVAVMEGHRQGYPKYIIYKT